MAMRMSARGAAKVASKARKLSNFGKCWEVGDKGIVLYPIYWDDETQRMELLVCSEWGYRVNDMDSLGIKATFIPSNAEINDDGVPVVPDIASQFSKLAPAFIAGEKAAEERKLEQKAWPTASAQKTAMENLEKLYDTKNNPNAKKAVIGKLCLLITTECVYIPIKNEKPDWDNARLVAQSLSSSKINKLMSIMDDKMYNINKETPYLEVQYNFTAADGNKSTAGKNDPVGLTGDYLLENRFPDDVAKLNNLATQLPQDSDIIKNHNYSYLHFPEAQLKSIFQAYCITKSENLDTVPEDWEDTVVNSSKFMDELSLVKALNNADLKQKITDRLAEEVGAAPTLLTPNDTVPTPGVDAEESVPAANGAAPKVQDLMGNPNFGGDELSDVAL